MTAGVLHAPLAGTTATACCPDRDAHEFAHPRRVSLILDPRSWLRGGRLQGGAVNGRGCEPYRPTVMFTTVGRAPESAGPSVRYRGTTTELEPAPMLSIAAAPIRSCVSSHLPPPPPPPPPQHTHNKPP